MKKTKISHLSHQVNKWGLQIGNVKFREAAPAVQVRAQTAARHWDEQLQIRQAILARRKANRESKAA
jgi:hypothetical protein